MADILKLIKKDKEVEKAIERIAGARFTFEVDDLEKMPEEMYKIIKPFFSECVKNVILEHIEIARNDGRGEEKIMISEIAEEAAERASAQVNENPLAMAAIWAYALAKIEEQEDTEEGLREKILRLAQGCTLL